MENNILLEMATVCKKSQGYGFKLVIYSNDHEPAHMHLVDYDDKPISKILLTNKPSSINEIYIKEGEPEISNEIKKKLLDWANKDNKLGINNWINALSIWDTFQKD